MSCKNLFRLVDLGGASFWTRWYHSQHMTSPIHCLGIFKRWRIFLKAQAVVCCCATLVLAACASAPMTKQQDVSSSARQATPENLLTDPNPLIQALPGPRDSHENQTVTSPPVAGTAEKTAHIAQARKMMAQANVQGALAHLDAYDAKWGVDSSSQLCRADALRQFKQLAQAETLYQNLASQSENAQAWYGLGKISIAKGDLQNAASRFEKSVQIESNNVEFQTDLGLVYLLSGKKMPAYEALTQAAQLANDDPKILTNLALWGLVYEDFALSGDIADRMKWSETTRNKLMVQANTIKKRIQGKLETP